MEDKQEDQELEVPHCLGCESYELKRRGDGSPYERCNRAHVKIANMFIHSKSEEVCPKGKGKYGKSNRRHNVVRRSRASIPCPTVEDRGSRPVPVEREGGTRPSDRALYPAWANLSVIEHENRIRQGRDAWLGTTAFNYDEVRTRDGQTIRIPRMPVFRGDDTDF